MQVILVEPSFPANQREFVRALSSIGANVIGIGESASDHLDSALREALFEYIQVPSVCDEGAMVRAVRAVQDRIWVDRMEATVEAHILPTARVREICTIPGLSYETCFLCRDKPAMKDALRRNGVRCAESIGSGNRDELMEFASRIGFPLIAKPRSGAGAAETVRVDDLASLSHALDNARIGHGGEVALEEFVEGHEGFYDTLTLNGQVVHEFISHYYPNVLEAMRTRWISPQIVATNRIDTAEAYAEVKQFGRKVIESLGIGTSATHMEWFYGPKGLFFSEIGCRPPGIRAWELYQVGNDIDLYREWAMLVTHGVSEQQTSRRLSSGIIALRPDRDGRITHYDGLDAIEHQYGEWIIDCHLPSAGTPTQGVEAGYMANAWVRMKHPDYDTLRAMLDDVGQTVQVHAQ